MERETLMHLIVTAGLTDFKQAEVSKSPEKGDKRASELCFECSVRQCASVELKQW